MMHIGHPSSNFDALLVGHYTPYAHSDTSDMMFLDKITALCFLSLSFTHSPILSNSPSLTSNRHRSIKQMLRIILLLDLQ